MEVGSAPYGHASPAPKSTSAQSPIAPNITPVTLLCVLYDIIIEEATEIIHAEACRYFKIGITIISAYAWHYFRKRTRMACR